MAMVFDRLIEKAKKNNSYLHIEKQTSPPAYKKILA
jgi:hypothetical protein